jgi:hypothetical protein
MHNAYVVTGTLNDDLTVTLDEALPLSSTRVRLVVERLPSVEARPYQEVVAAIRERQRIRGHQPPTREAVDADVRAERESWPE